MPLCHWDKDKTQREYDYRHKAKTELCRNWKNGSCKLRNW